MRIQNGNIYAAGCKFAASLDKKRCLSTSPPPPPPPQKQLFFSLLPSLTPLPSHKPQTKKQRRASRRGGARRGDVDRQRFLSKDAANLHPAAYIFPF